MKKRLRILVALLCVVILGVGIFQTWWFGLLGEWLWPPSPEKLAARALTAETVDERATAAVRLAECDYRAAEQLRRVLRESDIPEVRAACIQGLHEIEDYESMDLFIELLEDESLVVRGSAGAAVTEMVMGRDPRFLFRADAPEEERRQAIESLTQRWKELDGSPLLNRHKAYLRAIRDKT